MEFPGRVAVGGRRCNSNRIEAFVQNALLDPARKFALPDGNRISPEIEVRIVLRRAEARYAVSEKGTEGRSDLRR